MSGQYQMILMKAMQERPEKSDESAKGEVTGITEK